MELALYCPVYGYYEKEGDTIGRRGDYYTSVSVGSLFGQLLACQFAEWLEGRSPGVGVDFAQGTQAVQLVEAGAHAGQLAKDILTWLRERRRGLFERLEYVVVEVSERRREWQERTLAGFGSRVRWVSSLGELAGVQGLVFCNELLDALPARRLGWDAKAQAWYEWGVTLEGGRFVWTIMGEIKSEGGSQESGAAKTLHGARTTLHVSIPELPSELAAVLPDGFTVEVCPAAAEWWRTAAGILKSGKLVAIDYGLTADELLVPERAPGTLRAYYRHQVAGDVLGRPGEQDLTAHVNFTALAQAGEGAGLRTEAFCGQAEFLTRIAARAWRDAGEFGVWTPAHTRQFQTLTHPEHLGHAFRVLVQGRSKEAD